MESTPTTRKSRLISLAIITVLALLIPLVAMQFTDGVNWTARDFIVAAILFISFGTLHELVVMRFKSARNRTAGTLALIALFIIIWTNLSVGFFN